MKYNNKIQICFVIGTRPNFVKSSSVIKLFSDSSQFNPIIIHTGQHYDSLMSQIFLDQLDIPQIDYNLNVGKYSENEQVGKIIIKIDKILNKINPDWVFVFGDVNSTLAATIAAKKLMIKIAHIESGLRSNDMLMQEEINRILIDRVSDICFTTEKSANKNLLQEGIKKEKIFFVGNTMIDPLIKYKKEFNKSEILNQLKLVKKKYIVLTLHRPSNLGSNKYKKLFKKISIWNKDVDIVWPVHPRNEIQKYDFDSNWKIIKPLSYFDFIKLLKNSKGVFTDSGGIQEETTFLNIPCFTLRENTERPVTIELGTNFLVNKKHLKVNEIWHMQNIRKKKPYLWNGKSGKKIFNIFYKMYEI